MQTEFNPHNILPKLKQHIKSVEDLDNFINMLIKRIGENKPISDNPMLDGLCIGFIDKTKPFLKTILLTNHELGRVLDGTLQQIEHSLIWMMNNEDKLINILYRDKQSYLSQPITLKK